MSDRACIEEIYPYIQPKPSLVQFEAISSCSVARYLGEEIELHLDTASCQVGVESLKTMSK